MNDVPGASRLFVYGTLRDPVLLAEVLGGDAAWSYLGPGLVSGVLYDVGEYPALLLSDEGEPAIEGLLVELADAEPAFRLLDAYEGVDNGLYERRQCRARLANGSESVVWVYEYSRSVRGLPRLSRLWSPASRGNRFAR